MRRAAVLFGNEQSGLSNAEMDRCQYLVGSHSMVAPGAGAQRRHAARHALDAESIHRLKEDRHFIHRLNMLVIVDDQAPSPEAGLELAREILADCPEGYHPWRIQVQKSDRGRRSSVRVWFKRNVMAQGKPPD